MLSTVSSMLDQGDVPHTLCRKGTGVLVSSTNIALVALSFPRTSSPEGYGQSEASQECSLTRKSIDAF